MSGRSSPNLKSRISSQLSRIKKHFIPRSKHASIPTHPSPSFTPTTSFNATHHLPADQPANLNPSTHPVQLPGGHVQPPAVSIPQGNYYGPGMFRDARNIQVTGGNFIDMSTTSDSSGFMKDVLLETIPGAEFNSADRYPPPRCHPGTRLKIIGRCRAFVIQCNGKEKLRWVVGAAGVGKSAIMQVVAEETPADASVFLSVNGRQDGSKTVTTIAYQLAVKCEPYCQFIKNEFARDPSLFRKSLPTQFQKLIVEPFIHLRLFTAPRYLIIIDGLDECSDPLVQRDLLREISRFCINYPTSPIAWIIASRPEPHIVSFFENANVTEAYTKEEIEIDADDACQDVQRFLSDGLEEIRSSHPSLKHKREWPSELEFTKIATAAGGLFAYAATVIRYIGDLFYGDPISQLNDVLEIIEADPMDATLSMKKNPLAQLDALYERILFKIPHDVVDATRKVLLLNMNANWSRFTFRLQCNFLGLSEAVVYGATRQIHSVARIPKPDKADEESFAYLHKSFRDYLCDFDRSKLFQDINDDIKRLLAQTTLRVIEKLPRDEFEGAVADQSIKCGGAGLLKNGPGFCDNIVLSWPGDARFESTDEEMRIELYRAAMHTIRTEYRRGAKFFENLACLLALSTFIVRPGLELAVTYYDMAYGVFSMFHSELVGLGKVKQVPIRMLDYAAILSPIDVMLKSPIGIDHSHTHKCSHDRWTLQDLAGSQRYPPSKWGGWAIRLGRFYRNEPIDSSDTQHHPQFNTTTYEKAHGVCFARGYVWITCKRCLRRLARHFRDGKEEVASVFLVGETGLCCVEVDVRDEDEGGEGVVWTYRFYHSGVPRCG